MYKDIFEAINAEDIEGVKEFLPEQLNQKDNLGNTPLIYACLWSNIEIVKQLIEAGANITILYDDNEGYIIT